MGQAKLRKLKGTYPEQNPKPNQVNAKDAGRAFAALYREILDHLAAEFPDRDDLEDRAYAALVRMMELGAQLGFPAHEPLLLFVSWQDQTRGWLKLSMPEKWAIAKRLHHFGGFPHREAVQMYLERVKVRVEGDQVTFGAGSPWVKS
ncbi:hypothetical protein [Acidithiobacillus ferriphilus]|uniref:hypothetical protein n=1 Tax=Acidithiobacillus ferriphilus TaxID=1689834 RepID=UPI001C073D0F|nr:hypothetical protein [Acidithiobacillus ferriphilus]MBU2852941.1 hypothetical protein [Acidithiobacillus ferriphilus]